MRRQQPRANFYQLDWDCGHLVEASFLSAFPLRAAPLLPISYGLCHEIEPVLTYKLINQPPLRDYSVLGGLGASPLKSN